MRPRIEFAFFNERERSVVLLGKCCRKEPRDHHSQPNSRISCQSHLPRRTTSAFQYQSVPYKLSSREHLSNVEHLSKGACGSQFLQMACKVLRNGAQFGSAYADNRLCIRSRDYLAMESLEFQVLFCEKSFLNFIDDGHFTTPFF